MSSADLAALLGTTLRPLRSVVGRVQGAKQPGVVPASLREPGLDVLAGLDQRPLAQPDRSTCGSSVLVMMRLLYDAGSRSAYAAAPDPVTWFAREALATRRRTNSAFAASNLPQLPWPQRLGTRPAAFIHELAGITRQRWHNRVIDPASPSRWYDAVVAAGVPIPLYIGDQRWMQHIVLVVAAAPDSLSIYDPAVGHVVERSRQRFCEARLSVAGWEQPWLLITPSARHTRA